jgi:hypothetical protein
MVRIKNIINNKIAILKCHKNTNLIVLKLQIIFVKINCNIT